jgi:DNA polymerase V
MNGISTAADFLYFLSSRPVPFYTAFVPAGFPSPAADYTEQRLDLAEYLVRNKSATFIVRAKGNSMEGAGIIDGDFLVVDRSVKPVHNHIVLAVVDGEFTVKRLSLEKGKVTLLAENANFSPIPITEGMRFEVWGVVTFAVHHL